MSNFKVETWEDDSNQSGSQSNFQNLLPSAEIKKIEALFNKYDKNSSGFIQTINCLEIFKLAGQNYSYQTEKMILDEIDEKGTGIILFDDFVRVYKKYSKSSFYQQLELELAVKAFVTETTTIPETDEIIEYVDFEQMKSYLLNEGDCLYKQDLLALEKIILEKSSKKSLNFDQKSGKYVQSAKITVQDICDLLLQHLNVDSAKSSKTKMTKKSAKKPKKTLRQLRKQ
ncbi:troponin C [Brachionus plicatilis]|uniref:Troponin C n=1 Tax=Brachionus plicatilis TaxID=10195 RepID=A0A3M7REJ7_BRAPC|nr:troponin C [Brachionus plicatilis]